MAVDGSADRCHQSFEIGHVFLRYTNHQCRPSWLQLAANVFIVPCFVRPGENIGRRANQCACGGAENRSPCPNRQTGQCADECPHDGARRFPFSSFVATIEPTAIDPLAVCSALRASNARSRSGKVTIAVAFMSGSRTLVMKTLTELGQFTRAPARETLVLATQNGAVPPERRPCCIREKTTLGITREDKSEGRTHTDRDSSRMDRPASTRRHECCFWHADRPSRQASGCTCRPASSNPRSHLQ